MCRTADPLPEETEATTAGPLWEIVGADPAKLGQAAVLAGIPAQDDPETDLSDALANVMHYARRAGLDFAAALETATDYEFRERTGRI